MTILIPFLCLFTSIFGAIAYIEIYKIHIFLFKFLVLRLRFKVSSNICLVFDASFFRNTKGVSWNTKDTEYFFDI